ncbi:hypothetical protein HPP92_018436 [Vanilla planifolia]|uniref:non-specific serine/threonine protein kinase n=1 Tax=Vanilla planifolia TaxID=51239 RepID=A0A835QCY7_VANPL|nr:hypothetical protein HPP92_018436 [Vanilla planifolia]
MITNRLCCLMDFLFLLPSLFLLPFSFSTLASTDELFFNCGSSIPTISIDGRKWMEDNFSFPTTTSSLSPNYADPNVPSIPYSTARVSTSPFTYSFPVSPGLKLIHLHFYPAEYSHFTAVHAVFSVTCSRHTLLKNFNASQTAEALNFYYVIQEYWINASSPVLEFTFTPSSSTSHAFINGIEIISSPDVFSGNKWLITNINKPTHYLIDPNWAIQTVYRLNVGGQFIPPAEDSGRLFRSWEDDAPYIYGAGLGVSYGADSNVSIHYPLSLPEFVAPAEVYATARSMGPNMRVNLNYNLTWILSVDSGFFYLLRFHFCEIQYPITRVNQRVFNIYIQNHTAVRGFDVIQVSGGIGVPDYKDFIVIIPKSGELDGFTDLWIALQPNKEHKPQFYDAILNGLEVFKLEAHGDTLAGQNPIITKKQIGHGEKKRPIPEPRHSKSRTQVILGVSYGVGGLAFALLLFVLFSLLTKCRTKSFPIPSPHHSAEVKQSSPLCRRFSFADLELASNGFNEAQVIGSGGFGKVYSGTIDDGKTTVAIKRGSSLHGQGIQEFHKELETLSKLRHHHLVSLIGYCHDSAEMILVYDYMSRGNLREHLSGKKKLPLPWRRRLEICIGAARGLHYLHTGVKPAVIHRDVKTSNILLDEQWVAKVADFGLCKDGPEGQGLSHVSSAVRGTEGYMDPEYMRLMQLTEKSDVYAFGVVLLEVVSGRPAIDRANTEEENLVEWVRLRRREGMMELVLDPYLRGEVAGRCFEKFVALAEACVAKTRVERPAIGNVLRELELAFSLQLQEHAELEDDNVHADPRP